MSITVTGYHGTSRELANQIMRDGFQPSVQPGDWLGRGIYFWQDSLNWAAEWAEGRLKARDLSGPVVVIAAEIELRNCLDLCDSFWSKRMAEFSGKFLSTVPNVSSLKNNPDTGENELDCAFFNFVLDRYFEDKKFGSVRAPCVLGRQLFANSPIYTLGHIQLNVVDPSVIKSKRLLTDEREQVRTWLRGRPHEKC